MKTLARIALSLLCTAALTSAAHADVKLPAIFSTNMALQSDKPVTIWGWADPGEEVTVAIDGLSQSVKTGASGKWLLKLPAHAPGGPFVMQVSGKNQLQIENVVYGQVWLNSGQSNMYWPVRLSDNPAPEIESANFPNIRVFNVEDNGAATPEPADTLKGKWEVCSPKTAGTFSGAAYFMGRKLHQDLNQPVGLIVSCVGNTRINLWIPREALKTQDDYKIMLDREEAMLAPSKAAMAKYEADLAAYKEKAATRPAGEKAPPAPAKPALPYASNDALSSRYNAMISPLGPITLAGVTWYQGESNVDRGVQYFRLLPLMIASFRKQFESPALPFLVVQLPNMHGPDAKPPANAIWSEVRAAQADTAAKDPNVGLIVTIDVGNAPGQSPVIHPGNKQAVGDRLARKALSMVYGKTIIHSGPTFKAMTIEGDKVRLTFDNVNGGLVVTDDKPIRGFTLAGEDNQQYWADAVIDGETIVLSAKEVPRPVWVRYAWTNNPNVNLASKSGLPMAPFRTDDLLLSTRLNH